MGSPSTKKFEFLVNLDYFLKYLKYLRNFELGCSQIKIDKKLISLYSLQSKIGVHLLNGELTQLLTLDVTNKSGGRIAPLPIGSNGS